VTAYYGSDPVKVGTGIVLNPGGLVLTNQHVISAGTTLRIAHLMTARPPRPLPSPWIAVGDLAMLQIQGRRTCRPPFSATRIA